MSSILFFLVISLGGGVFLHKTVFKDYNLKQFWLAFAKAGIGCAFVFALPWALYFLILMS